MDRNLAKFGEELGLNLYRLRESLNNVSGLFADAPSTNEDEFASRLSELQAATKSFADKATELREALRFGIERDASTPVATLSRWIGRRQTAHLHSRADLLERLATIAVELATLSALEAERITMTAIRARKQAVTVQVQRDAT